MFFVVCTFAHGTFLSAASMLAMCAGRRAPFLSRAPLKNEDSMRVLKNFTKKKNSRDRNVAAGLKECRGATHCVHVQMWVFCPPAREPCLRSVWKRTSFFDGHLSGHRQSLDQKMNCARLSNPPLSMFVVASLFFRMFTYQLGSQRVVDVCGGSRFAEVCDHPATPKTFSFCLYALVYDPRSHNMPVCVLRNGNFRETLGPRPIFPQLGYTYTLWCVSSTPVKSALW